MSGTSSAKKLKAMFDTLGVPPTVDERLNNLEQPDAGTRRPGRPRKAERMVQLNLRVPEVVKDRVRLLATRDRTDMSQIVIEAIELYEERYGAVPILAPTRKIERGQKA